MGTGETAGSAPCQLDRVTPFYSRTRGDEPDLLTPFIAGASVAEVAYPTVSHATESESEWHKTYEYCCSQKVAGPLHAREPPVAIRKRLGDGGDDRKRCHTRQCNENVSPATPKSAVHRGGETCAARSHLRISHAPQLLCPPTFAQQFAPWLRRQSIVLQRLWSEKPAQCRQSPARLEQRETKSGTTEDGSSVVARVL